MPCEEMLAAWRTVTVFSGYFPLRTFHAGNAFIGKRRILVFGSAFSNDLPALFA